MPLPSVFSYLEYRPFLQDWFEARKRQDPTYSYARFAADGECSRSSLANVISGARTPRPATLDAFARAMDLQPPERNYLGLLVELANAPDVEHRRQVMDRILASERYGQVRMAETVPDSDLARYLEGWHVPAIKEMALCDDFRADPEWIVSRLREGVTTEQVEQALETLFDLDFLRRSEDGRVEVQELSFRTEPDSFQRAVFRYQRFVLPPLLASIDTRESTEQQLLAATVSLSPDMVAEAKVRLNDVVAHLASMGDALEPGKTRRVYQLAVQLLPVTGPLDGPGNEG